MTSANLYGAELEGADFTRADLRRSNMTDGKILGAKFEFAKMQESIGTNGRPWGYSSKQAKATKKKSWWKTFTSRAAL